MKYEEVWIMTHEEIESAIEQLRELGSSGRMTSSEIVDAIFDSGNNYEVRDSFINLLKQADPDTHLELPNDADGETIRIGDKVEHLYNGIWGAPFEVVELWFRPSGWMVRGERGAAVIVETCRHYCKPNIEDVLRVFARTVAPEIVWDDEMHDKLFGEYAERILEVMGNDDQ